MLIEIAEGLDIDFNGLRVVMELTSTKMQRNYYKLFFSDGLQVDISRPDWILAFEKAYKSYKERMKNKYENKGNLGKPYYNEVGVVPRNTMLGGRGYNQGNY